MNVQLIASTNTGNDNLVLAACQCYNEHFDISDLTNMSEEKKANLIKKVVSSGHTSITEHITYTFLIEDVSRALTHQLVRHRMASYSQRSGRYTGLEEGVWYVTPPSIKTPEEIQIYVDTLEHCRKSYLRLCELGVPKEDARYLLNNCQHTNIVCTMNPRGFKNFFAERLCTRAQWEIRNMAGKMAGILKENNPLLFETCKFAYPKCEQLGYCPEDKGCGRKPKLSSN